MYKKLCYIISNQQVTQCMPHYSHKNSTNDQTSKV